MIKHGQQHSNASCLSPFFPLATPRESQVFCVNMLDCLALGYLSFFDHRYQGRLRTSRILVCWINPLLQLVWDHTVPGRDYALLASDDLWTSTAASDWGGSRPKKPRQLLPEIQDIFVIWCLCTRVSTVFLPPMTLSALLLQLKFTFSVWLFGARLTT